MVESRYPCNSPLCYHLCLSKQTEPVECNQSGDVIMSDLKIRNDLQSKLSNPCYRSMFLDLNQYRTRKFDELWHIKAPEPYTPAHIAREIARSIVNRSILHSPEVMELSGPIEFYRAHDGGSISPTSAGTLGRSWFGRELLENLWASTAGLKGEERVSFFMSLLRSCNLVLREWNGMIQLACMSVPAGCQVVVVRGKGNWKAMFPPAGRLPGTGSPSVPLPKELTVQLEQMAHEETVQFVVPLFNSSWVFPVVPGPTWPFHKKI